MPVAMAFDYTYYFTDARNDKTYPIVQIGYRCWFAENMDIGNMISGGLEQGTNCNDIKKYCYDNDPNNCDIYGGLYQGNMAMCGSSVEGSQGICPEGWHVPKKNEWGSLVSLAEPFPKRTLVEGDYNELGFSGMYAGGWIPNCAGVLYFGQLGSSGNWWTSLRGVSSYLWSIHAYSHLSDIVESLYSPNTAFSVRCIKDDISMDSCAPPEEPVPLDCSCESSWVENTGYAVKSIYGGDNIYTAKTTTIEKRSVLDGNIINSVDVGNGKSPTLHYTDDSLVSITTDTTYSIGGMEQITWVTEYNKDDFSELNQVALYSYVYESLLSSVSTLSGEIYVLEGDNTRGLEDESYIIKVVDGVEVASYYSTIDFSSMVLSLAPNGNIFMINQRGSEIKLLEFNSDLTNIGENQVTHSLGYGLRVSSAVVSKDGKYMYIGGFSFSSLFIIKVDLTTYEVVAERGINFVVYGTEDQGSSVKIALDDLGNVYVLYGAHSFIWESGGMDGAGFYEEYNYGFWEVLDSDLNLKCVFNEYTDSNEDPSVNYEYSIDATDSGDSFVVAYDGYLESYNCEGTSPPAGECGNFYVEGDEECDFGDYNFMGEGGQENGYQQVLVNTFCSQDCTLNNPYLDFVSFDWTLPDGRDGFYLFPEESGYLLRVGVMGKVLDPSLLIEVECDVSDSYGDSIFAVGRGQLTLMDDPLESGTGLYSVEGYVDLKLIASPVPGALAAENCYISMEATSKYGSGHDLDNGPITSNIIFNEMDAIDIYKLGLPYIEILSQCDTDIQTAVSDASDTDSGYISLYGSCSPYFDWQNSEDVKSDGKNKYTSLDNYGDVQTIEIIQYPLPTETNYLDYRNDIIIIEKPVGYIGTDKKLCEEMVGENSVSVDMATLSPDLEDSIRSDIAVVCTSDYYYISRIGLSTWYYNTKRGTVTLTASLTKEYIELTVSGPMSERRYLLPNKKSREPIEEIKAFLLHDEKSGVDRVQIMGLTEKGLSHGQFQYNPDDFI